MIDMIRPRMWLLLAAALPGYSLPATAAPAERPNFVIIFLDDVGYGDFGCFGSKTIETPRIDKLAEEGTKFTSFYAQVVCGMSRSALLTGRYPIRSGGWSVPESEVMIPEVLKQRGYRTVCLGKWDVSNRRPIIDRMPLSQGFDYFYGTLGANDSGEVTFYENNEPVGKTKDMGRLTRLYTDKAIEFIRENKDQPFLLYLPHNMAHSVVGALPKFKGKSKGGLYGDVIEELDFYTGKLLDALDKEGLRDNTIVIFTSDNGPWNNAQEGLRKRNGGAVAWGSSGPLREGKGSTYEGGSRVPCIVRWPGHVPAGRTCDAIFATIDFLPTIAAIAGCQPPTDRTLDGIDQTPLLTGQAEKGRDEFLYFPAGNRGCCHAPERVIYGIRQGRWKLLPADRTRTPGYVKDKGPGVVELFDLDTDIGEQHNLADQHPDIVQRLAERIEAFKP